MIEAMKQTLNELIEVRHALQMGNDTPNGGICDTIWMIDRPETLFDFIDESITRQRQAIAEAEAEAGQPRNVAYISWLAAHGIKE